MQKATTITVCFVFFIITSAFSVFIACAQKKGEASPVIGLRQAPSLDTPVLLGASRPRWTDGVFCRFVPSVGQAGLPQAELALVAGLEPFKNLQIGLAPFARAQWAQKNGYQGEESGLRVFANYALAQNRLFVSAENASYAKTSFGKKQLTLSEQASMNKENRIVFQNQFLLGAGVNFDLFGHAGLRLSALYAPGKTFENGKPWALRVSYIF
jgi:hypothetical protein